MNWLRKSGETQNPKSSPFPLSYEIKFTMHFRHNIGQTVPTITHSMEQSPSREADQF
jgi:hypothetical protein